MSQKSSTGSVSGVDDALATILACQEAFSDRMDVFGVKLENFCDRLDAIEGRLGVLEGLNPGHRPWLVVSYQGEDPLRVSTGGQPQCHRSEDDEVDSPPHHQAGDDRTLAGPPPSMTRRIRRRATR
ncbi:hypothetical protein GUJ93_ZPchr0015g6983 [Zizania palustris]|uniref:Uncharacterized protein n=1 Tax=Zizania palustris TaxID=103762 RepID=A0A8J5W655_ZIZPA|nr:hypothetical protein GUJ93_ZPchr0015g6983 [Zizania palustris]